MDINSVKAQIKSGEFDKWYIFYGEEHKLMKIYIDMMAKKGQYELQYVDTISDVFSRIRQSALIPIKHMYVIIDDKEFMTNEKAWSALGDGRDLKDDIVIFYFTSQDKRLKFWKNFQNRAVEFAKLDDRLLTKYIQKEIDLSDKNCKKLIEVCEGDYSRILLEIDKIKRYHQGHRLPADGYYDSVFEDLLKDGTIYQAPKDAIFDLVNAILDRDAVRAFSLLEQSYAVGEANMVILSVLYNSIKTLLQVQSCQDTKKLGLNGFSVKNILPFKNNYTNGELVRAMKLIRRYERGIKTGERPDDISVQSIMVQMI